MSKSKRQLFCETTQVAFADSCKKLDAAAESNCHDALTKYRKFGTVRIVKKYHAPRIAVGAGADVSTGGLQYKSPGLQKFNQ